MVGDLDCKLAGVGGSLEFWLVVPICTGCGVCLQRLIIRHLAARVP